MNMGSENVYDTAVRFGIADMYECNIHYLRSMAKYDDVYYAKRFIDLREEVVAELADIAIANKSAAFLEALYNSRPSHAKIIHQKIKMNNEINKQ